MVERRIAVVTGSSRGIGRGLAEILISEGWTVLGCSRTGSDLNSDNYDHRLLDVGNENDVSAFFADVQSRYGQIDALINNAGLGLSALAMTNTATQIDVLLRTNLVGTMLMCREAARLMVVRRYGRIVNIASVAVPLRTQGSSAYSASKAAVIQYTKVLARELGSFNVTCNVVAPSLVPTEMYKDLKPEALTRYMDGLTIKRVATIEDLANAVSFFISEVSGYITGQVLYLGLAD